MEQIQFCTRYFQLCSLFCNIYLCFSEQTSGKWIIFRAALAKDGPLDFPSGKKKKKKKKKKKSLIFFFAHEKGFGNMFPK